MNPNSEKVTIGDNLLNIERFINEIIISPKSALQQWALLTKQTPAAKIGYIGQHLASLITGVPGTGSGARGDDLNDGSEVKSCNKVDQVDKCKNCGARVMRMEDRCSACGSDDIDRKDDSKWLFSVRDEYELNQYQSLDRIFLLLMDYPNFDNNDFEDIRIVAFEIYPKEKRMEVFNKLIANHYWNIYMPKQEANQKTNPMNLHPWSFQFYKCNPIKVFECTIKNINTNPQVIIDKNNYIQPLEDRDETFQPIPMPSDLLKDNEWAEMLEKADFDNEIYPLLDFNSRRNLFNEIDKSSFRSLSRNQKCMMLPYLDQKLRDYISLRPIKSTRQKEHYQRG